MIIDLDNGWMLFIGDRGAIRLRSPLKPGGYYNEFSLANVYAIRRGGIVCQKMGQDDTSYIALICEHANVSRGPGSSARCDACGEFLGWYCPTSPTRQCVYTNSWDECDYCGQPQERK